MMEAAETLIKQGFSDETASEVMHIEALQNRINEAKFLMRWLRCCEKLEIKNEQIKELNERLSECSAAVGGNAADDTGSTGTPCRDNSEGDCQWGEWRR